MAYYYLPRSRPYIKDELSKNYELPLGLTISSRGKIYSSYITTAFQPYRKTNFALHILECAMPNSRD